MEDRRLLSGLGQEQVVELFSTSPALFVENQGQWADESVRYLHQGDGVNVAMTDAGVVFQLFQREADDTVGGDSVGDDDPLGLWSPSETPPTGDPGVTETAQFSVSFDGANLVEPVGLDRAETYFNYFIGAEENWHPEVPSYEIVAYQGLYDGIDLHTWGLRSHLKYEFHVAAGAEYRQIQIRYEGIEGLSLSADSALEVSLGDGWEGLVDNAPYIYQVIDGVEVEVPGRFVLLDDVTYTFAVSGDYDPGYELVIDPTVAWSSYLGGDGDDWGSDIAVDASGNAWVTGDTYSSGWVSGGFDTTLGGERDAFVARISASGQLLWASYLGGERGDGGRGIALDSSGGAWVAGYTSSSGWVSGGFNDSYSGSGDAFVARISAAGKLLWSSYLGGDSYDWGNGIAVDASGNAWVTGDTYSSDWVSDGFDTRFGGGWDTFVARISAAGQLLWSSYLGGDHDEEGESIAVDAFGNAFVTGSTRSGGWVSGGFDTTLGGNEDAFVARISAAGQLLWSSYLGGSDRDWGMGIAVDASGNAWVTGSTYSSGWVSGGFDTALSGVTDAFVARISSAGQLLWSSYLGGSVGETGWDIAAAASDSVWVTGRTSSSDWVWSGFDTTYGGGVDAFVARISEAGQLLWSSYLGGNDMDRGYAIALDASDNAWVTGATSSPGWVSGGFDTSFGGGWADPFVARITDGPAVVQRAVFYNDSCWDTPGEQNPEATDDAALAFDKKALLPDAGQATFENYTSYVGGINGIMVDVAGLPVAEEPIDPADYFDFATGNDDDPAGWDAYLAAPTVAVCEGEGVRESDRMVLTWPDHDPGNPGNTAVGNAWLEVTVLANEHTGLAVPDVFYFGNAIGETGDSTLHARVDANDILRTRNNPHPFFDPADIYCEYDFNRDGRVDTHDIVIVRNNQTTYADELNLIDLSAGKASRPTTRLDAAEKSPADRRTSAHDAALERTVPREWDRPARPRSTMDWLWQLEPVATRDRPARGIEPAERAVDLLLATDLP